MRVAHAICDARTRAPRVVPSLGARRGQNGEGRIHDHVHVAVLYLSSVVCARCGVHVISYYHVILCMFIRVMTDDYQQPQYKCATVHNHKPGDGQNTKGKAQRACIHRHGEMACACMLPEILDAPNGSVRICAAAVASAWHCNLYRVHEPRTAISRKAANGQTGAAATTAPRSCTRMRDRRTHQADRSPPETSSHASPPSIVHVSWVDGGACFLEEEAGVRGQAGGAATVTEGEYDGNGHMPHELCHQASECVCTRRAICAPLWLVPSCRSSSPRPCARAIMIFVPQQCI